VLAQVISLVGAALILVAYGLNQRHILGPDDASYNLMNFVGAALLTWIAVLDGRAGFIVVEGTWTVMSLIPLVRRSRTTPPPPGLP